MLYRDPNPLQLHDGLPAATSRGRSLHTDFYTELLIAVAAGRILSHLYVCGGFWSSVSEKRLSYHEIDAERGTPTIHKNRGPPLLLTAQSQPEGI